VEKCGRQTRLKAVVAVAPGSLDDLHHHSRWDKMFWSSVSSCDGGRWEKVRRSSLKYSWQRRILCSCCWRAMLLASLRTCRQNGSVSIFLYIDYNSDWYSFVTASVFHCWLSVTNTDRLNSCGCQAFSVASLMLWNFAETLMSPHTSPQSSDICLRHFCHAMLQYASAAFVVMQVSPSVCVSCHVRGFCHNEYTCLLKKFHREVAKPF